MLGDYRIVSYRCRFSSRLDCCAFVSTAAFCTQSLSLAVVAIRALLLLLPPRPSFQSRLSRKRQNLAQSPCSAKESAAIIACGTWVVHQICYIEIYISCQSVSYVFGQLLTTTTIFALLLTYVLSFPRPVSLSFFILFCPVQREGSRDGRLPVPQPLPTGKHVPPQPHRLTCGRT